jgi:membrane-associated phospholipid phosphatase
VNAAKIKHFLQDRTRRELSFVQDRLSPEGLFGRHFTLGATVFVGATWLFGGISEDLISGDPLIIVDAIVSEWFRSHATPGFSRAMNLASALASATTVSILTLLMAVVLMRKRLWYRLLELVLVVGGGLFVNVLLKDVFDRARPGWADPLMALAGPGFPSGHTMMAMIIYGFMAVAMVQGVASWLSRFLIFILAVFVVFIVALSRMYLGAHYLSDVLAAIAAGLAWLALCLTSVETLHRHRVLSRGSR